MYEHEHDPLFSTQLESFLSQLHPHIANDLFDSFDWAIARDPRMFTEIAPNHYLWVRPELINVPRFFIVYKIDDAAEKIYYLRLLTESDFLAFLLEQSTT